MPPTQQYRRLSGSLGMRHELQSASTRQAGGHATGIPRSGTKPWSIGTKTSIGVPASAIGHDPQSAGQVAQVSLPPLHVPSPHPLTFVEAQIPAAVQANPSPQPRLIQQGCPAAPHVGAALKSPQPHPAISTIATSRIVAFIFSPPRLRSERPTASDAKLPRSLSATEPGRLAT